MGDLLNKKITIESLEQNKGETNGKEWQVYKVTDQDKNKYSFFTSKQDGTETKAFQAYKELQLTLGSEIGIGYVEEEKEFTDKGGEKRKYQQRTIRFFESLDVVDMKEPVVQVEPPTDEMPKDNYDEPNSPALPF